ncbi:hypothetical protein EDC96DRAFT_433831 [Choanephora cucurbitarum]|nr:hypothetical protein EDC96DRAFT_433831 [Choanephora cucurbitarum]
MLKLGASNQLSRLDIEHDVKKKRPLRSLSSVILTSITGIHGSNQYHTDRSVRAALLLLYHTIDFKQFREFSAETTILSGLEKGLLKYDEIGGNNKTLYKFGVMTIHDGQDTEDQWLSNSKVSRGLNTFLHAIGKPVKLQGYKGFAAGLDTKTGESGKISFASTWREFEIMYHVAPLMPSRETDPQQIHKKRYIGNDIVCIIFMEGKNQTFNPSAIQSQLSHVFIVVQSEYVDDNQTWRVEVLHHKNIEPFTPALPPSSIFYDPKYLASFLMLKCKCQLHKKISIHVESVVSNKCRECSSKIK